MTAPSKTSERRFESVVIPEEPENVSRTKRSREENDLEDDDEESLRRISRQRRVSILPGSIAYNEAIMASFEAFDVADASESEDNEQQNDRESDDVESECDGPNSASDYSDDSLDRPGGKNIDGEDDLQEESK
jgi:hypothetical protein